MKTNPFTGLNQPQDRWNRRRRARRGIGKSRRFFNDSSLPFLPALRICAEAGRGLSAVHVPFDSCASCRPCVVQTDQKAPTAVAAVSFLLSPIGFSPLEVGIALSALHKLCTTTSECIHDKVLRKARIIRLQCHRFCRTLPYLVSQRVRTGLARRMLAPLRAKQAGHPSQDALHAIQSGRFFWKIFLTRNG